MIQKLKKKKKEKAEASKDGKNEGETEVFDKDEEVKKELQKNKKFEHFLEKFSTHPCHAHRFEDLEEQLQEMREKAENLKQQKKQDKEA